MEASERSIQSASELLEEYNDYFDSVQYLVESDRLLRNLPEKNISYNPQSTFEGVRAQPVSIQRRGAIVHFRVDIGGFTLMMLVLNVADKASKTCRERLYENSKRLIVVQERMTMRAESCVCKRTGFRDTTKILTQKEDGLRWEISGSPSEVKEVVIECAFAKLCSALGIGVPIGSPDHPYDLVCYEDCIEFFMEKCTPLKAYPRIHPLKTEKRLKYCVQVMHTFHLIHKDLKLENTLVTEDEVIVLADFGISAHVKETAGQASATFRQGTYEYMSPAMLSLQHYDSGKVDLYYNDMWALKVIAQKIRGDIYEKPSKHEGWNTISISDQVIYGLTCVIEGNIMGEQEKEAIKIAARQFASYFKEFGQEVKDTNYKMDMVLRHFEEPDKLIFYLQQLPRQTPSTQRLTERLSKNLFNPNLLHFDSLHRYELIEKLFKNALRKIREPNAPSNKKLIGTLFTSGLNLSGTLFKHCQYEECLEVLNQLRPFVKAASAQAQQRFQTYQLLTELLDPTPCEETVERLLVGMQKKQSLSNLRDILWLAFRMGQYGTTFRILHRLFRYSPMPQTPSAKDVVDCLRTILVRNLSTMSNQQMCCELITLYGNCSEFLCYEAQFPNISESCLAKLPAAVRYHLALLKASKMPNEHNYEEIMSHFDEAEEIADRQIGCPYKRVHASMMRCQSMVQYKRFEELEAILVPNIRFVQTTIGDGMQMLLEKMLSRLKYHNRDFKSAVDSALRAMALAHRESLISRNGIEVLSISIGILREVGSRIVGSPRILEAATVVEQYLDKPTEHHVLPFHFCSVYFGTSFLFSLLSQSQKTSHYESTGIRLMNNSVDTQSAADFLSVLIIESAYYYRLQNDKKAHDFAVLAFELIEKYYKQLRLKDLLLAVEVVLILFACRDNQLTERLIKLVVIKLGDGLLDSDVQPAYAFFRRCYDQWIHFQLENLVRPLVGRHPLGKATLAKILAAGDRANESQQLFLQYLSNLPPGSPQVHRCTAQVYNEVRILYNKKGDYGRSEHYLNMTLEAIRTYRERYSDTFTEWGMLFNIFGGRDFKPPSSSKLFINCLCRLVQLQDTPSMTPEAKRRILDTNSRLFYAYGRYSQALICLQRYTEQCPVQFQKIAARLRLVYCLVILRRPRAFYRVSLQLRRDLLESTPSHMDHLGLFLNKRRESIKWYLLMKKQHPKPSAAINRILAWLDKGLPEQYGQESVQKRLKELAFLKRFRSEALREGSVSTKEQTALILLLLRTF